MLIAIRALNSCSFLTEPNSGTFAAPFDASPLLHWRDDALAGVRLGVVEAHVPRGQMTAERLVRDLDAQARALRAFDSLVGREVDRPGPSGNAVN